MISKEDFCATSKIGLVDFVPVSGVSEPSVSSYSIVYDISSCRKI